MFTALSDRVVLKKSPEEKVTTGGIIIPDTIKEGRLSSTEGYARKGEVVSVGPGRLSSEGVRLPIDLNVGDIVWIRKWEVEHTIGEDDYLIVRESDVLCVEESSVPLG